MSALEQALPMNPNQDAIENDEPVVEREYDLTTTQPGPNESIDRDTLGEIILSAIDWDESETREGKRGEFQTTQAFSWYMTHKETGDKYQISLSVNHYPKKDAEPATKGTAPEGERFKLSNRDLASLDAAVATMKEHNDFDNALKLATIKSTFQQFGNVTREQFLVVAMLNK